MLTGNDLLNGQKLSKFVALEHIYDDDENPSVLVFATFSRIPEDAVEELQERGKMIAEVDSDDARALEAARADALQKAVSHELAPGMQGHTRPESPERVAEDPEGQGGGVSDMERTGTYEHEPKPGSDEAVAAGAGNVRPERETGSKSTDEEETKVETKEQRGPREKPKQSPKKAS